MSLYATYTFAEPLPTSPLPISSSIHLDSPEPAYGGGFQDTVLCLAVIGAESAVAVAYQMYKRKKPIPNQFA